VTQISQWKQDAQTAFSMGDIAAAEQILQDAIAAYPDDTEPNTMLCHLYLNQGDYSAAFAALDPVLDRLNSSKAYLLASRLLLQMGSVRPAIDMCAKSIALTPGDTDSLIHMAQIYTAYRQNAALAELTTHAEKHLDTEALAAYHAALQPEA